MGGVEIKCLITVRDGRSRCRECKLQWRNVTRFILCKIFIKRLLISKLKPNRFQLSTFVRQVLCVWTCALKQSRLFTSFAFFHRFTANRCQRRWFFRSKNWICSRIQSARLLNSDWFNWIWWTGFLWIRWWLWHPITRIPTEVKKERWGALIEYWMRM